MLRIFFKYNRKLLGSLCRSALRSLTRYFGVVTWRALTPGIIAAIQTFGDRINARPHLHFLVTEGGMDKAGLFHKLLRLDDSRLTELFGREVLADLVRKQLRSPEWAERILSWRHTGFNVHSRVRAKDDLKPVPSKGWAAMIRKVYEVDPMVCPQCGRKMRVITFLTDSAVVDLPDILRFFGLSTTFRLLSARFTSI